MDTLVIAICTRARPATLRRLLDCLAAQSWPPAVSVLVVDNDHTHSAQSVVDAVSGSFPVSLDYLAKDAPGYSTVRNAALDRVEEGVAVCFIDDDAMVPEGWVQTMRGEQLRQPEAVIRSRYLHVAELPSTHEALTTLVQEVRMEELLPAGTSGLLLPASVVQGFRFDSYFDLSGAEDMDLLARLDARGVVHVLAAAVVVEEDRVRILTQAQQRELARWNGRLATIAMARRGTSTLGFRVQALLQSLSASAQAAVRLILRRPQAASAYRNLAVSRWAMVTAPIRPPASLPARPVL
ncbi:MAG: glycosyltransferase family A protein [Actinomycetota bacterium]|nr:glycosyltransferase family A protein [Actinomycetota bacterium]